VGFHKPDAGRAQLAVRQIIEEIRSPYRDGFTQSYCKRDLYMLKCWLEDEYSKLPTFIGEDKWEQERVIQILKNE
jgi:hypothetical protein